MKTAFDAASEERLGCMDEWQKAAEKSKGEGDMYGWNFYQGMAAGGNWCDILYGRVRREVEKIEAAAGRETPPPETQQKPHHWTFREATSLEGSRDATRFAGAFYDATGAKLSLIGTKDAKRIEAWLNAPPISEEG